MFRSFAKFNCTNIFRLNFSTSFKTNLHPVFQVELCDLKTQKCSALLLDYGFNIGQVNRILKSPQAVLTYGEKELLSNLTYWLQFGTRKKLFTALCACPELLTLNPDFIEFRIKELMTLFTRKDINKLLVTCPPVFLDDFTTVFEKVQYMVHMMGAEQKSIVKTRALQYDLNHIKCRHTFMVNAGKYIKRKRDEKSKNPPLNKIFSRNIQTYLKLTRLTEEEFQAYCRYFDEGLLEFSEDEDSDNEEDD